MADPTLTADDGDPPAAAQPAGAPPASRPARRRRRAAQGGRPDRGWVLDRLVETVERAMQPRPLLDRKGQPTGGDAFQGPVALRALELIGRELGMFGERREAGSPLAEAPEAELDRIIRDRAAEIGLDLVAAAEARPET